MSFASDTKNELSRIEPEKKCCMLAEISGFLRVAGSIGLVGLGKFRIKITTENPAVARHYKKLLQDYFGIETKLEIGEGNNRLKLVLDNHAIRFTNGGITIGEWDGENFYTGDMVVKLNQRAQFGNFAFVPRSDKSLMFLKVQD